MHSCLYAGRVSHRRLQPVAHRFDYRIGYLFLDLDELDRVFRGRWLWSAHRPAPARFHRGDHLGDPHEPLADAVRALLASDLGLTVPGPIRLLTQPRYFGYGFNPVSFYYCYDAAGVELEAIVAEVTNTPWGERHAYAVAPVQCRGRTHVFRLAKSFHVSPFMPMDIEYEWRLTAPARSLAVHMRSLRAAVPVFEASLALARRPLHAASLAAMLASWPPATVRIIAAIYWQALLLWRKGAPFHPHPKSIRTRSPT
ncbi:MAG: DUF1365 domain-containing protein [Gammaproteobacteria bacterium]